MQSFYKNFPPPATQTVIDRDRDEAEWRRTVGISLVICVLVVVAVFAVLQAWASPRREFIPVPMETVALVPAPPQKVYSLGGGQSVAGASTYRAPVASFPTAADPVAPPVTYAPRTMTRPTAMPVTQLPPTVSTQAPVDLAAKTRQIEDLKTRIDALDEQVRIIRTNPKDSRYWWHYPGRFNGIDQQALDNYLKQLDKQRNDLRRQKWTLEGR